MYNGLRAVLLLVATGGVTGVMACRRDLGPVVFAAASPWHLDYALGTRQGIELAVDEINAAGGIRGRPLQIRWCDDSGSGAGAVAVAESVVADTRVLAVIGHMNSDAMLAAARIYDHRVTAISPAATTPDLSGLSHWVFRVITSDSANGAAVARFAVQTLGAHRAAVLFENDAYGRGLARAFRHAFAGTIVASDPIAADAATYEPYITYLRTLHPDVVFVAGLAPSGLGVLRDAKRQRMPGAFVGGDGWIGINSDTVTAEGAYIATPFTRSEPRPEVRQFTAAFETRFHAEPEEDAALAYDATQLFAAAVTAAGPSRDAVRRYLTALDATHPFTGVTGRHYFLPTGDPAGRSVIVARVRHGTLTIDSSASAAPQS